MSQRSCEVFRLRKRFEMDNVTSIDTAAEILRDEGALFDPRSVRYVDGKIEVEVGFWAWRRLREIYVQDWERQQKQKGKE